MALFIIGSLPITNSVSAEDEVDNWPENDAWLHIELISWSANETVEWDNNGGLPDPIFKICIEADGDNLDCINTPTWENQMTLNNSWNHSIDIPDHTNILNITIECEDNDALNDDECDMNSELGEWKLYAEYNWSATPTLTVTGNGDGDGDDTWKNAASTWNFTINGFGDEDGDGVSDNIDLCVDTPPGEVQLNSSLFIGCSWGQLDPDLDGLTNNNDSDDFNYFKGAETENPLNTIEELIDAEWNEMGLTGGTLGTNLNLILFQNISHFMLETGIVSVGGMNTPYEDIICTNQVSEGECNPLSPTNRLRGDKYSFDYDGDGDLDFISNGEIFILHEGKFWRKDLASSNPVGECRASGTEFLWLDLGFDGNAFPFCLATSSGTQYLLESACKQIHDLKFEEATQRWILICIKESTDIGNYEVYLDSYSTNGTLIDSTLVQNSIMNNGITIHILLDIDQNGRLDLLYENPSAKFCLDIKSTMDLDIGCQDILWETPWGYISAFEEIFYHDFDGDGDVDVGLQQGIIELTETGLIHHKLFDSPAGGHGELVGTTYADLDNDGDYDFLALTEYPYSMMIYKMNPAIKDTDGDGIKDSNDLCDATPVSEIVNSQGCSDTQLDDDSDGVFNPNDICQNTQSGQSVDSDGCSEYQKDSDVDGIVDALDECPNTPEGDLVNIRGCSFEDSQDLDSDNDGVLDSEDACPNTPADVTVDSIGCDLDGNQTPDTDSDGDGVYDSLDDCANTPFGAIVDFTGCPMDSDSDGVYDGIDECPSSNNPSPSDMDKSSEVDSTGCFIDAAGSESDSDSAAFGCLGMIVMIGVVVFVVRKVRNPKQEQVFQAQTQSVSSPVQQQFVPIPQVSSVPTPQVSSRERQLEHQSRQAQIEAQRLRQELANQAQFTQQLQSEAAQKQMSEAALAQKQHELAVAQQEKEELEAKLAEAEKNTPIVQHITYNIQDSAISGDITNKITRNDSE